MTMDGSFSLQFSLQRFLDRCPELRSFPQFDPLANERDIVTEEEVVKVLGEVFLHPNYTIPLMGCFRSIARKIVDKAVGLLWQQNSPIPLLLLIEPTEQSYSICEAREEEMVSTKDGNITRRIGRFLKPFVRYSYQAVKVPNVPLLSEIFSHNNSQSWHSKVHFKGWKQPQKRWDEWIDKLAGKYGYKWNQAGICDAIMSSRYETQ